MKRIISFFDNHRVILVFGILLIVILVFIGIQSIIFLNHDFKPNNCTKEIDDNFCEYKGNKIFREPKEYIDKFLKENDRDIEVLVKEYDLPELNKYTVYFYELASKIDYNVNNKNEKLYDFFAVYDNTYNLEEFYIENNFYYGIFYNYKII